MSEQALKTALRFTERGWYVFPVRPGTKFPYKDFAWRTRSTNNPEIIKKAARAPRYHCCNWALDCGRSNVLVVDVDKKPDKDGAESLKALPRPLETHYQVKTPSGGFHYYFSGEGPTGASNLGPGLDTRGAGGYVLIPGSEIDGKPYREIFNENPAPLPQWLSDLLGKPAEKKPDQAIPLTDYDKPHNIEAAKRYLIQHAPEAIEGSAGDQTTYGVACRLRDMGISQETALDLMIENWNPDKAHPPWSIPDLTKKIANAFTYAKDRPGNATPDVLFPNPLRSTKVIRCAAETDPAGLKPREWLLGYRYLREYLTLTIAPGGVGKSLLTILEALSVSTGKQLTHDVVHERGAVWLYNTEDPFDELERRIEAACKWYKIPRDARSGFYYSSGYENPIKFVVPDDYGKPVINESLVASVIDQIRKREIRLFIVDPFVECHSVNENDNTAVATVVQAFRRIAKETRCAISLVHHTSKGKYDYGNMDKARGASALIYGARIAHTLYPMTDKECKSFGIPPARSAWYVRLDDAKANLAPPASEYFWYEKKSVRLFFDSDETTGTLVAVNLDRVTNETVDNLITDAVINNVSPGGEKSVYSLQQDIETLGLVDMSSRALRRKIAKLFSSPVIHKKNEYMSIQKRSAGGKATNVIVCSSVK